MIGELGADEAAVLLDDAARDEEAESEARLLSRGADLALLEGVEEF